MERLEGIPVAGGIAIGRICFQKSHNDTPYREEVKDAAKEVARFEAARDAAVRELDALARQAEERVGEADAAVFTAQKTLAADAALHDRVCDTIREKKVNAAYAVTEAQAYFTHMLLDTEEDYVRERAADVADVASRLLCLLAKAESAPPDEAHSEAVEAHAETRDFGAEEDSPADPVILAAEELLPSETMRFEREKLLALVTRRGSATSHTAILARAMHLPMLSGVDVRAEWDGRTAVVDGTNGALILDPEEDCLKETREKIRKIEEKEDGKQDVRRARPDTARVEQPGREIAAGGGQQIRLYANIAGPSDLDAVRACGAEGIGLYRTEFLFLGVSDWPTEEEQFAAYRAVAEGMDGKPVIIRTLDVGADKQAPYMNLRETAADRQAPAADAAGGTPAAGAEIPAGSPYGARGIRVCLERPEMFRAQLRAILRAAAYGTVSVMFPMITSVEEVRACKAQLERAREEAASSALYAGGAGETARTADRTPCGSVAVGIMIETPEAVAQSAALAREVDFFSIGTNDLQQYLLGIDRQDAETNRENNFREQGGETGDPLHPALAQAITETVESAHAAGIPVGICGEMAADPAMTERLAEMGVDSLSAAPGALAHLREVL